MFPNNLLLRPFAALSIACLATARAQDDAPPPAAPPVETGLTGAVTEAEFLRLHELKEEDAPEPRGEWVELGNGARAYLSMPVRQAPEEGDAEADAPSAAFVPGLVVIHEWWGLNRHVQHWADRLAEEGFAALAVDLYGGRVASTPEEAMAAMRAVDAEAALDTLRSAHAFLVEDPRVRAPRTGSIGWCFGGAQSLRLALAEPALDACVLYYGKLVTDAESLRAIRAPVLGVFGTRDPSIPEAEVARFEAALAEAGVRHRVLRYDAEHAFANPSSQRYDRAAAGAAWEEVRAFLRAELLRPPPAEPGDEPDDRPKEDAGEGERRG